jgi:FlgD Ig-like domain
MSLRSLFMAAASAVVLVMTACVAAASSPAVSVTLQWTTPGDDGMTGRATRYDMRYSMIPITELNFATSTVVSGLPSPAGAGTTQTFTATNVPGDVALFFAMKTVDEAGNWSPISNVIVHPSQTADVPLPSEISFSTPYPNPVRQVAHMSYTLPRPAGVRVDAFDVSGRHVRTIADGFRDAGAGQIDWNLRDDDGRPLGAGVYLVRAQLADRSWTRRVVAVR